MEAELFKPLNLCFWVLKVCGMWQDGKQTWKYFFLGYLFRFLVIELFLIGQVLYMADEKIFSELIKTLSFFVLYFTMWTKSVNFLARIQKILKSVENLKELLDFSRRDPPRTRDNIRKRTQLIFNLFRIFLCIVVIATFRNLMMAIITRKMPINVWYPFSTENFDIGFWIGSLYMVAVIYIGSSISVTFEVFPVIFISFAIGLVEELADRLSGVEDNDELIKCIKIHLKIKEFIKEVQDSFELVLLIQGFTSSTSICLCVFSLSIVSRSS